MSAAAEDPWAEEGQDSRGDENPWGPGVQEGQRGREPPKTKVPLAPAKRRRTASQAEPTVQLSSDTVSLRRTPAAQTSEPRRATSYETKGSDANQIRQRLLTATCKCQDGCHRDVRLKALTTLCQLFWGLQDLERHHLVRTLYWQARPGDEDDEGWRAALLSEAEPNFQESRRHRMQWALCGRRVCFPMWVKLLGTSQNSVRNWIQGVPDGRRSELGGELCPQSRSSQQT